MSALRQKRTFQLGALVSAAILNSVLEIKQALRSEGYPDEGQLQGQTVTKQLSKLIADAKAKDRK